MEVVDKLGNLRRLMIRFRNYVKQHSAAGIAISISIYLCVLLIIYRFGQSLGEAVYYGIR